MSIINKLTEGIVARDVTKEGAALLEKWEHIYPVSYTHQTLPTKANV